MLFIDNKYTRWYNSIIANAQARTTIGYTEKHHIIPKSLGGSNTKDNLVMLTAKEHFICHWLLTKMTIGTDKSSMFYALNGMKRNSKKQSRYTTKITSRVFERSKIECAKLLSIAKRGKPLSEEHKQQLRKPKSAESIANRVAALKGRTSPMEGKTHSEETKQKMRKPKSELHKQNMSKPRSGGTTALKGRPWSEARHLAQLNRKRTQDGKSTN